MLIRRLLAAVDAAATASSNASACEADCTAILANISMICLDDDLLSPIAADCLDNDEGSGIFGSYLILWRCGVHQSPLALLFLVPWLLMLLMALGSTADNFLMPQLHYLSELLRLSPDVAGVTLLAVGNGAPDVFSAIAVATANANKKMDLSFMLSDIVGGYAHSTLTHTQHAHTHTNHAARMPRYWPAAFPFSSQPACCTHERRPPAAFALVSSGRHP